ncbi:MAG: hypothetical protein N3G75_06315 [Methanothrix sp.]|nr:hypothetical protein [Methanothrix sp.]MCX8207429.1 hypothetical protein [Methanothrix sp.]
MRDLAQSMEKIGVLLENAIIERIRAHIPPPLKPETVRRKGSSTPLIDTGQLIGSITHQIRAEPDRVTLYVGIFDPAVLEYAGTHEYGDPTRNIPERSFLRSTFDEEKEKLIKIVSDDLKKLEVI